MKLFKNVLIVAIGSCCTFLIFDYTLGTKNNKRQESFSEENAALAPTLNQTQTLAVQSAKRLEKTADFYQNTFQDTPDASGVPRLKPGKRFYNEALMNEVATSANLEVFTREN